MFHRRNTCQHIIMFLHPFYTTPVLYLPHTYHPTIHGAVTLLQTGEICLDILKTAWSPAWTLHSVCQAVMALMSDPAADSPLNCDAGEDVAA
jgi:peroxin-4